MHYLNPYNLLKTISSNTGLEGDYEDLKEVLYPGWSLRFGLF